MKLSRTTLLLIVLGILIIAFANMSAAYSQQVSGQNQLNDELALARTRLGKLQPEPLSARQSELQGQLAQTLAEVDSAKAQLIQPLDSIDATDSLLSIAALSKVRVTSIASSGVIQEELNGLPATALLLNAKVEGKTPDLVAFISELNSSLPTGLVRSVEMSTGETPESSSARVQVAIYSYQGS